MTPVTFSGRSDFQRHLAALLGAAEPHRELHAWDASFVDWPLSDPTLLAALTAWARPGRRLHLLAWQFDDLAQRHPRFVRWRRDRGHCVSARAVEPETRLDDAPEALLVVGPSSLRLFDRQLWRGELSATPAARLRAMAWIDAVTQRSAESFASTTLGL
jgi:hypothetical protein